MPASLGDLDQVLSNLTNVILVGAGIVFLGMLILSGFNYLNAGTSKESASKAQQTLTWSFVGLTVTASAWLILNLIARFLGVDNFGIFTICINSPC